jgi:tellurium resistance protein TerD
LLLPIENSVCKVETLWDGPVDIDMSAILLGADGRIISDEHYVFYNQPRAMDNSIRLETQGNSDLSNQYKSEILSLDLAQVSQDVVAIRIILSIYPTRELLSFGNCRTATASLSQPQDFPQYTMSLSDDFGFENFIEFGDFTRSEVSWRFAPSGKCGNAKIKDILFAHGAVVERSPN